LCVCALDSDVTSGRTFLSSLHFPPQSFLG
jgi:hypothetical protein